MTDAIQIEIDEEFADHLMHALDVLSIRIEDLDYRIRRAPKTHNRKPNLGRAALIDDLRLAVEANNAIAEKLGVSPDFHERNCNETLSDSSRFAHTKISAARR